MKINLHSILICPNCKYEKEEIMPTNSCAYFYECKNCKQILKPKKGDCCIFCSYRNMKCPSIQQNKKCCWF
ncbi:GDCCVxC domain-containing (seleno)protein [Empedobacter tilapiae]